LLVHELDDTGEDDHAIGSWNSIDDARAEQVTRRVEAVMHRDDGFLAGIVKEVSMANTQRTRGRLR
jgi:hypothetical protein